MAHFSQEDRVSEVYVRGGRIETDLHGQRAFPELSLQVLLVDQVYGAAAELLESGRSHGG